MPTKTFSDRQFDRHPNAARKAADQGPVLITDRGRAAYVLLSIDDYLSLRTPSQNIATLLAMPDMGDFDLPVPTSRDLPRATELD
jgi:prevent-host-death family protein